MFYHNNPVKYMSALLLTYKLIWYMAKVLFSLLEHVFKFFMKLWSLPPPCSKSLVNHYMIHLDGQCGDLTSSEISILLLNIFWIWFEHFLTFWFCSCFYQGTFLVHETNVGGSVITNSYLHSDCSLSFYPLLVSFQKLREIHRQNPFCSFWIFHIFLTINQNPGSQLGLLFREV